MFGPAGTKIPQVLIKWKGQHAEFPAFNLDDKVLFQGGIVRQEESSTVPKQLLRYNRKNKR